MRWKSDCATRVGFTIALALAALSTGRGEEQTYICRFCEDAELRSAWGIDLEGDGFRYAPDRQVDVVHIKLDVTPDFQQRTVSGTTTITFQPISQPLEQLRLDAIDLTIRAVRSQDAKVRDFVSSKRDLTILFQPAVPVDQRVSVEIDYEAEPTQGLYFRTPEMGYPKSDAHVWTQGEAHEARYWFPCFDYPNERSSTEVVCRVPADMIVLSNGKLMSEEQDTRTGLKSVRWLQEKPHVNYLICLVAGYFEKLDKRHRDIPLAFYTQPSLAEHAENSFQDTDRIMAFFEEEIGVPFPWDKYSQVTIRDFTAGGMENTSLTTLTDGTIFTKQTENIRSTRGLDAHEMAHQWFGDYVTCKDWSHLWLNEGFATYYAHLYEGHKFGRDALLYGLYRDAHDRVLTQRNDQKPIVYKAYKNAGEQFDYRAYPKGSWVLHMLRNQLGEDLYRRSIKTYLESHALNSVVTDDLRQVIEQRSGRPMDRFFDQWVYHARHPDVKVTYRWLPKEELAHVKVTQTHNVDDAVLLFHFPTTLRFIVDGQAVNQAVEISDKEHDFYVPLAAQPTIVRFDPELTVLADVTFDKPDEMLFAQIEYPQDMIGRLLAAEALGKRKTKKAVDALRKSLNGDPFFGVRIAASGSLREIHNDDAFAALRDSREQPDARVRQQVVADLSRFFREETLEVLEQVVATEHNPAIQASAIQGLGRFHGPRARKVIKQYLKSNSFRNELAGAAIRAIRMQDDAAYGPALLSTLRRRESDFTSRGFGQGLEALAHVNRKEEEKDRVREFLVGFLNHPQRSVQRSAISALGTLADPKALAVLQPLARDVGDPVLSRAARSAVEALEQNKPATPAELVELRKIVTELKAGNEELRKDLDDLKNRVEAKDDKAERGDGGSHVER